jgi:two-component system OmpR family sensor kinase
MSSIRRRLLAALLGALLLAGLLGTLATYVSARDEVDQLLDEELRQVALSLRDHARLDLSRLERVSNDPELRVLVQIWDPAFERPYTSRVVAPLPRQSDEGYSTLLHDGRGWRVYTVMSAKQTIQVAQPTLLRTELAARTAARLLLPVLVMLPLLGLIGWWIVGRGLTPLMTLAQTLERRAPTSLEPIELLQTPVEVRPLVNALNDLLARLGAAVDTQRRFAADAAHELRSPLAALTLQVQLAQRAESTEDRAIAFAQLEQGIRRATRLVGQLLTMARLDPEAASTPTADVDLAAIARGVVDERRAQANDAKIALTLETEEARLAGQEDALAILIANLVDNALRHTPAGGSVRVAVRRADSAVSVEVSDTGPGIPGDERSRVFDRFYRGRGAQKGGSGLGLAIVRQVAEMHSGTVELDEAAGGGLVARARFAGTATPQSDLRAA